MVGAIGYSAYGMYNISPAMSNPLSITDTDKQADTAGVKQTGAVECQTCKNREYQDGSNESDVSFKAPGHISPESSAATVMSHEQEHVSNAYEKAAKGNGKVVAATVSLHTAVCPECGRSYVSGGVTNTVIKYNESTPYGRNAKQADAASLIGSNVDIAV